MHRPPAVGLGRLCFPGDAAGKMLWDDVGLGPLFSGARVFDLGNNQALDGRARRGWSLGGDRGRGGSAREEKRFNPSRSTARLGFPSWSLKMDPRKFCW